MSWPRWTCASKISPFSGSTETSSCAYSSTNAWARASASSMKPESTYGLQPQVASRAVTDLLIWADTLRSPEMRHEVPVVVPDPFLYLERDGERHVVITPFEVERVQAHDGLQPHPFEEFGWDELVKQGVAMEEVTLGTMVRAVKELGVREAVVPASFPLELADRLRAAGVELNADRETFVQRRRVKTEAELKGIR